MISDSDLSGFYGSETFIRWTPLFRNHLLTEGTNFVAEKCEAFWLMDAIASHHKEASKACGHLQFWTLKKVKDNDNEAVLTCQRDSDVPPCVTQKIKFTDFWDHFQGDEIRFYVGQADEKHWTVMLPSEY